VLRAELFNQQGVENNFAAVIGQIQDGLGLRDFVAECIQVAFQRFFRGVENGGVDLAFIQSAFCSQIDNIACNRKNYSRLPFRQHNCLSH